MNIDLIKELANNISDIGYVNVIASTYSNNLEKVVKILRKNDYHSMLVRCFYEDTPSIDTISKYDSDFAQCKNNPYLMRIIVLNDISEEEKNELIKLIREEKYNNYISELVFYLHRKPISEIRTFKDKYRPSESTIFESKIPTLIKHLYIKKKLSYETTCKIIDRYIDSNYKNVLFDFLIDINFEGIYSLDDKSLLHVIDVYMESKYSQCIREVFTTIDFKNSKEFRDNIIPIVDKIKENNCDPFFISILFLQRSGFKASKILSLMDIYANNIDEYMSQVPETVIDQIKPLVRKEWLEFFIGYTGTIESIPKMIKILDSVNPKYNSYVYSFIINKEYSEELEELIQIANKYNHNEPIFKVLLPRKKFINMSNAEVEKYLELLNKYNFNESAVYFIGYNNLDNIEEEKEILDKLLQSTICNNNQRLIEFTKSTKERMLELIEINIKEEEERNREKTITFGEYLASVKLKEELVTLLESIEGKEIELTDKLVNDGKTYKLAISEDKKQEN